MVEAFGQYDVAQRVIDTPIYQQAYELFSADPDKKWLMQLESIPQSIKPVSGKFLQPGKSYDANNKLYSQAIQQVNNLIQKYQEHQNSLPVNQVAQAEQAGFNMGVTGQGLEGSQMNSTDNSFETPEVPSDFESGLNLMGVLVNGFSAVSGGITSFMNAFNSMRNTDIAADLANNTIRNTDFTHDLALKQFNLSKDQFDSSVISGLSSIRADLESKGLTAIPQWKSYHEFADWFNDHGRSELAGLYSGDVAERKLKQYFKELYVGGIRDYLTDTVNGSDTLNDNGSKLIDFAISKSIQQYKFNLAYQNELSKYNYFLQKNLDPVARAKNFMTQDDYDTAIMGFQASIAKHKQALVDANDSLIPSLIAEAESNPSSRALLVYLLTGLGSREQSMMASQGTQDNMIRSTANSNSLKSAGQAASQTMETAFDIITLGAGTKL